MSSRINRRDIKKEKYWRGLIREGARSRLSIREFCQQSKVTESQFYTWRRNLRNRDEQNRKPKRARINISSHNEATFALVTDGSESLESAGIELVLEGGRRLRIGKGVDPETLAGVVAVLEQGTC